MLNIYRLLLTALFLLAAASRAEEACPSVELDAPGQMAYQIPVWDQSHFPACFAFSASLLANIWIREDWANQYPRVKKILLNPTTDYRAILKSPLLAEILDPEKGRTCQAFDFILRYRKEHVPMLNSNQNEVANCSMWGLDQADGHQLVLKAPEVLEARLHELLTKSARPRPFAIEYCSAVFENPENDFIINRTFKAPLSFLASQKQSLGNFSEKCGFHSAVVLGQKMRSGKCHFKIRNSFGTGDANYNDDPKPRNENNEHGNYWIPAEALSRNLLRVIEMSPGQVVLSPAEPVLPPGH